MKPLETLSMIEEAAGTRMFESKKQAAIKTIEKKQLKVDEITRVMDNDITPRLQQLRSEKQSYQEWSSNNTELEKLERLCTAQEYKLAEEKVLNSEGHQSSMRAEMETMQQQQAALQAEAGECERGIAELERKREIEQEGEFQALKQHEQELSKELVKVNTTFTNQKSSLANETEVMSSTAKQVKATEKLLSEKIKELDQCEGAVRQKEEETAQAEEEMVTLRTKYQNACAGVTDESDAALLSLPEQIGVWETRARESQSKLQQETMRIQHSKDRLKDLKRIIKTEQAAHSKDINEVDALQNEITDIERRLSALNYQQEDENNVRGTCAALQSEIQSLQDAIDNLTTMIEARVNFEFRDPERGFDRSRVKGVVAKLVNIKESIHATALEIAAGGKLFQVVVDNEQTGKLLLGKNVLKKRVTILPLNKINNKCLDPNKLAISKRLAQSLGGSANLALELVGYDEEVTRAMQYVFGNSIICSTSAVAEAIAFNNEIRCRTISLEGDTYDPSGTVTGGSKNQIGSLLTKIAELTDLQTRYQTCQKKFERVAKQLASIETVGASYRDLFERLDMRRHALAMCQEKFSGSSYAQTRDELQGLEQEITRFDEVSRSFSI
jgi:structural maintenance of chromosome 2